MSLKKAITFSFAICVTAFSFAQTTAREYYEKAVEAEAGANYTKALEMLYHSLQLNVKYDSAYCLNGIVYYKQGNFDLAIKQLDKALAIQPSYFEGFMRVASLKPNYKIISELLKILIKLFSSIKQILNYIITWPLQKHIWMTMRMQLMIWIKP